MPQRCMCPNFNWEYRMIAELQRRKLNMFKWREGMLSPRALFKVRSRELPSGQLWFVPSRFQPCLTNLPTVKRPFHVGWFYSRVSVLNNICYRQGVIWFHVNQRCVVRGIALSSFLSCWLLANLNSRGSSVAPTWAHLCWPGSRSVHGSIHSCTIGWPHLAWRGHPKYCLGCLARSRRPPSVNES